MIVFEFFLIVIFYDYFLVVGWGWGLIHFAWNRGGCWWRVVRRVGVGPRVVSMVVTGWF